MFYESPKVKVFLFFLAAVVVGCSILKKEDAEKDIRTFLTTFQNSLSKSDDVILDFFNTPQSDEAIMLAVNVLRNKDLQNIQCVPSFDKALIYFENDGIRVVVPATIQSTDRGADYSNQSTLTLYLERNDDSFYISKLEGDEFYNNYASLRNQMDGSLDLNKELLSRQSVFEKAKELQQQYDSVIWYTQYDSSTYFYVVKGKWSNYFIGYDENSAKPTDYKMGLVDHDGNVIVPVEYELIGTLGFSLPGIVEVKKDGKVGYFNLKGEQLIAPEFEMIIPYGAEETLIVKKDSVYGWFNTAYQYYPSGFSSPAAKEYVQKFQFLPTQFMLGEKAQALCEIPNQEYIGYGIVVPATYWTKTGIFNEIMGGFTNGDVRMRSDTEYIETESSVFESVSENLGALIMTIKERYLEGREEFYVHNRLVFVNANHDTLATHELYSTGTIEFNKLNESLIELRYTSEYEADAYEELPIQNCNYFELHPDFSITHLQSNRRFDLTQFVKIDSSYFTGEYRDMVISGKVITDTQLAKDLTRMRNEILADYGYRFSEKKDNDQFKYRKWYKPEFDSYSQIEDKLTEIDKYNLAFLEKLIGPLKENVSL